MLSILKRLTFGNPKHLIRPAVWIFFEDFFNLFPALIIYMAINMLAEAFHDADALNLNTLLLTSGMLIVLALIQFVIGFYAFRGSFIPAAEHTAQDRIAFVKKLRRLPLGFFSKKEKGELINNFVGDFINLQTAMTGTLSGLFSVIVSCVLTAVFLFLYNPLMAGAFYIALPVAAVLMTLSMKTLDKNATRVALARDQAATNLNEYLGGMKTLKSYNQTGEGCGKLKAAYQRLMESHIKEESGSGSLMRLCTSLVQMGLPLLCMAGGYLLLNGKLGIVAFIGIIIIGTKILTPVVTAVSNMMMLRGNYVSARRLDATMQEREMCGAGTPIAEPEIRFRNVSFSYQQGGESALDNVSFTVPKGKLTAIVGPSGSGKSTILRLISRFWDVTDGDILINDTPVSALSPEAWQQKVSMVLQDVYLFRETIRENILFGRRDATEEEMIDAAKRAGCHAFITALPDGYDTMVGEGGSTLSGGERQRISIARALLKNAPILLLDEPTASLDAINEALVQKAIGELVKNTTVIMIAHRLKTVQNAAQILVLEDGNISETGSHESLLAQNGLYARLWRMQQKSLDWNMRGQPV